MQNVMGKVKTMKDNFVLTMKMVAGIYYHEFFMLIHLYFTTNYK